MSVNPFRNQQELPGGVYSEEKEITFNESNLFVPFPSSHLCSGAASPNDAPHNEGALRGRSAQGGAAEGSPAEGRKAGGGCGAAHHQ